MEKNDLIENLQTLGIPRREAEVYLALLQKSDFTAPEIAKITSVTRTKSYEILQNLVKKGLCTEHYRNGVKTFSCINPEIVMEGIKSEYDKKKKVADEVQQKLFEIHESGTGENNPLDYIEVLTDGATIKERWQTIQSGTEKELLIFTKPPYTGTLEDNIDSQSDVMHKGITYKSIYEYKDAITPAGQEELAAIVESYINLGEEARLIDELPMKLVISDETITMFALNDRISLEPSITTMLVNHPSFAFAMKKMFQAIWENSLTLDEYREKTLVNKTTS